MLVLCNPCLVDGLLQGIGGCGGEKGELGYQIEETWCSNVSPSWSPPELQERGDETLGKEPCSRGLCGDGPSPVEQFPLERSVVVGHGIPLLSNPIISFACDESRPLNCLVGAT